MSETRTRERILDVAEKLFADNGFEGTSLRMITAAADVNLAAVHYHFGSKTGLLHATAHRRIDPVNVERIRRLDAAIDAADGTTPPVEAIVDAFVRPAIEALSEVDRECLLGMLRLVHGRDVDRSFFEETFGEVIERFSIMQDAVPHLDREELQWRFHFMVGAVLQAFHHRVLEMHPEIAGWEPSTVADAAVAFVAAGFRAPATHGAGSPSSQESAS
jgi:AcrR family transcriptional regulator